MQPDIQLFIAWADEWIRAGLISELGPGAVAPLQKNDHWPVKLKPSKSIEATGAWSNWRISENGMVHQFQLFPVHIFPKPMEFSVAVPWQTPLGPQTVQEVYPKLVLEDLGNRGRMCTLQISFISTVIVRKWTHHICTLIVIDTYILHIYILKLQPNYRCVYIYNYNTQIHTHICINRVCVCVPLCVRVRIYI